MCCHLWWVVFLELLAGVLGLNVSGWESSGELNVYAHVFVDEGLQCFLGRTGLLALGRLVPSLGVG